MKKTVFIILAVLSVSLTCAAKSRALDPSDSKHYILASDYVASDGSVDVADALQALIDANPNKTIFFPDGTYLISKPLFTPANPRKAVHLVLANFAVIKAVPDWKEGSGAMLQIGGKDPYNDITINGSNYGVQGGIFDGSGVADGISVNSGRESRICQVSIKNTRVGIHIMIGVNASSSDVDVIDVNIVGNNQSNSIGLLLEGHDNTFTNIRIAGVNKGVWIKEGCNSLKNIHPLYIFAPTQDYESSVGFIIENSFNNFLDYCYADGFATSFKFGKGVWANLTDCFCYWYDYDLPQRALVSDGPFNAYVYGLHAGFREKSRNVNLLIAEPGGKGRIQTVQMSRTDFTPEDVSSSYLVKE